MKKVHADVCIVGAGPAGSLLGLLLARMGIKVILLERHNKLDKEFRGEHFHGGIQKTLRELGLLEKIAERGILPIQKIEYFDGLKKNMSLTSDLFGVENVGLHIPQKNLIGVLIDEARQFENFELLLQTKVIELIRDLNGQVIGVKAIQNEEELEVSCSILVGADGRFSTIRRLLDIPTEIIKHGYDVLWAKIPAPPNWEASMRLHAMKDMHISVNAHTGGFIQIGWGIEEGTFPALRKKFFDDYIQMIIEVEPQLESIIKEHLTSWDDFTCLAVQSCKTSTWVKDGAVIIGDAAHTMSPAGGVGVNFALVDAVKLAPILEKALQEGNVTAERLKIFEDCCRPDVEKMQFIQKRQEASQQKMKKSKIRRTLLGIMLRTIDRLPIKRQIFGRMFASN